MDPSQQNLAMAQALMKGMGQPPISQLGLIGQQPYQNPQMQMAQPPQVGAYSALMRAPPSIPNIPSPY